MASGVDLIYIVITIIIVAILLIVIIYLTIWGTVQTIQNGSPDTSDLIIPLDEPVSFGVQCGNYTCDIGLVCDSESQTCKKAVGQVCHVATDCVTGSFCSGICTDASPGIVTNTANSPCPCPANMECITILDGSNQKLCKLVQGEVCTLDNDCLSNQCLSGKCSSGLPPGSSCTQSSQCQAGETCSKTFCQLIGIETGSPGAACDNVNGPGCDIGSSCINGVCISSTQGLQENCDTVQYSCSTPLACVNDSNFSPCTADDNVCICLYPYTVDTSHNPNVYRPNPNSCNSTTKSCSGGGTCNQAGLFCQVQSSMPCVASSQCLNGTCSGGGKIYRLNYTYYDNQNNEVVSTNPLYTLDNVDVSYSPISTYSPILTVSSIVGYSGPKGDGSDDVLFYVIPGTNSDPANSGLIRTDGKNIIYGYSSSSAGTMTLLDVTVLSPTVFLVLFNETRTSPSMTNKTVYIFNPVTGSLTPYNVTSSSSTIPGTQFVGSTSINAISVSASYNSDTTINVLLFTGSAVYVKNDTTTTYSLLTASNTANTTLAVNSNSKPKYYSTVNAIPSGNMRCTGSCPGYVNVSYIYPFSVVISGDRYNGGNLLQFNGSAYGAVFPEYQYTDNLGAFISNSNYTVIDYSTYSNTTYGLQSSYIMMIATDNNAGRTNLYIVSGGITSAFPGYTSPLAKVLALGSSSYLYSPASCVS